MTYEEFLEFLSQRLTQLRMKKGVTAREMGIAIGHSENYISMIEARKSSPSMRGLVEICDYLEVTFQEFFDDQKINPVLINKVLDLMANMAESDLSLLYSFAARLSMKEPPTE